ncbi:hypothetical protein Q3G72_021859 [Acer saccharum]|nr:hypothetical protein Q3G72_021859 [Acer saccharum]
MLLVVIGIISIRPRTKNGILPANLGVVPNQDRFIARNSNQVSQILLRLLNIYVDVHSPKEVENPNSMLQERSMGSHTKGNSLAMVPFVRPSLPNEISTQHVFLPGETSLENIATSSNVELLHGGIANKDTRQSLKQFCTSEKPDIICLAKPWIDFHNIRQGFWKSINMKLICTNNQQPQSPNLWLLADRSFPSMDIIHISAQQITVSFSESGITSFLTCVYASVFSRRRLDLWNELHDIYLIAPSSWMVIGDFNAVFGAHEKIGRPPIHSSCQYFNDVVEDCHLNCLATRGSFFTWTNGRGHDGIHSRVEERLDRALCSEGWLSSCPLINCYTLPKLHSDHNPLVVDAKLLTSTGPKPFRFHRSGQTMRICLI